MAPEKPELSIVGRVVEEVFARRRAEQIEAEKKARAKAGPASFEDLELYTEEQLEELVLDPLQWVVHDLLPVGVWLCSAAPKIGKSFLMSGLCRAVATGTLFANYKPTTKGAVLYLDFEGSTRRAKKRQLTVRGFHDRGVPDFHTALKFPNMDRGGIEILRECIQKLQLTLVIVDVWGAFRPPKGKNEDGYAYDYRSITPVVELAAETGTTIVLVHHNRKQADNDWMAETSGSTGLTGAVDGMMSIKRERGQEMATLSISGRDVDEQQLAMRFNAGLWSVLGDAREYFAGEHRKAIHGLLSLPQNRNGMSLKDIAEDTEMRRDNCGQLLKRLLSEGVVASPRRGFYMLVPSRTS